MVKYDKPELAGHGTCCDYVDVKPHTLEIWRVDWTLQNPICSGSAAW